MKIIRIAMTGLALSLSACATLTEDAYAPTAFSFSDGSDGQCNLNNKRGNWQAHLPGTVSIRKSDDQLRYDCTTDDGRRASGGIPSEMGGKIIASAVFLDFGITDAITDKHRRYPASFVIPIERASGPTAGNTPLPSATGLRPQAIQYLCKDEKGEPYLSFTSDPKPGCVVR